MESRLNSSNYTTVLKCELKRDTVFVEVDIVGDPMRPRDAILTVLSDAIGLDHSKKPPRCLRCKQCKVTAGFGLHTLASLEFQIPRDFVPQCEIYFTYNPGWSRCRVDRVFNYDRLPVQKSGPESQTNGFEITPSDQAVPGERYNSLGVAAGMRSAVKTHQQHEVTMTRTTTTVETDTKMSGHNNAATNCSRITTTTATKRETLAFESYQRHAEGMDGRQRNRKLEQCQQIVSDRHAAVVELLSRRLKELRTISKARSQDVLVEKLLSADAGVLLSVLPRVQISSVHDAHQKKMQDQKRSSSALIDSIFGNGSSSASSSPRGFDFEPVSIQKLLPRLAGNLDACHDEVACRIGQQLVRLLMQIKPRREYLVGCSDELLFIFNNAKRALRSVRVSRSPGPLSKIYSDICSILGSEFG